MANANEASPANSKYILAPASAANGTGYVAELSLPPAHVVRCFGEGNSGDGYKVSRQWVFRRGKLVFSLYDWKSTDLYDCEMWSSEEQWRSSWPFDLHIGSKAPATEADVEDFIAYLFKTIAEKA